MPEQNIHEVISFYPAINAIAFWLVTVVLFGALIHYVLRSRGLSKELRETKNRQTDEAVGVLKTSLGEIGTKLESMGKEFRAAIGDMDKAFSRQDKELTGVQTACSEKHRDIDRRLTENDADHREIFQKIDDHAKENDRKFETLHQRITNEIGTSAHKQ